MKHMAATNTVIIQIIALHIASIYGQMASVCLDNQGSLLTGSSLLQLILSPLEASGWFLQLNCSYSIAVLLILLQNLFLILQSYLKSSCLIANLKRNYYAVLVYILMEKGTPILLPYVLDEGILQQQLPPPPVIRAGSFC